MVLLEITTLANRSVAAPPTHRDWKLEKGQIKLEEPSEMAVLFCRSLFCQTEKTENQASSADFRLILNLLLINVTPDFNSESPLI